MARLQLRGKQVTAVPMMSAPARAWVGAFIDADGCVGKYKGSGGSRVPRTLISAAGTDVEHISTLLRLTRAGRISMNNSPRQFSSGHKPMWQWQVGAQVDVEAILEQCAPYSTKMQSVWPDYKEGL
mgnify:CR=1 FL=1